MVQPTSRAKTTSLEAGDSFLSRTLSDVRIDYLSRAFRGKKKFWFWPFLLHTPALTGLTLDSRLQQTWAQINEEGLRVSLHQKVGREWGKDLKHSRSGSSHIFHQPFETELVIFFLNHACFYLLQHRTGHKMISPDANSSLHKDYYLTTRLK